MIEQVVIVVTVGSGLKLDTIVELSIIIMYLTTALNVVKD